MFEERDLIHRYTRAQAIAEGTLVDATDTARQAGFRYDLALTRACWERCVTVPEGVSCQSVEGRLWDVLTVLSAAIRRGGDGTEVPFAVHVRNTNRGGTPPLVRLKAVCGPGDHGEPVVTVMLPEED
jgi:hypothetical protein